MPNLSSVEVRREMFKLFYKFEAFDLNQKADSFEAYDFLLTCIHSWIQQSQENHSHGLDQRDSGKEAISAQLANLSKI